jgi:hypothetical protein
MSAHEADVIAAAAEVVQALDGTYGKSWDRVADELDEKASDGEQTYADPGALAALIRALVEYGALQ